jgi:hypothetical protein
MFHGVSCEPIMSYFGLVREKMGFGVQQLCMFPCSSCIWTDSTTGGGKGVLSFSVVCYTCLFWHLFSCWSLESGAREEQTVKRF